jgi:hypothetical protein
MIRVVRLALVVISMLVLAWTAVLLRDHHVGQAAFDDLRHRRELPPARFARDMQRLEDAKFLNPDSTWDVHRGSGWLARRRPRNAIRVVEKVVNREPANLDAWSVLYVSARGNDPRLARKAWKQLERLAPRAF